MISTSDWSVLQFCSNLNSKFPKDYLQHVIWIITCESRLLYKIYTRFMIRVAHSKLSTLPNAPAVFFYVDQTLMNNYT